VSLVHESLVAFLNRRCVSTYYDVYPGPGHDAEGFAFGKKLEESSGRSLRYGALLTPAGELIASFGFERDEFVAALRSALAAHPELNAPTDEERALLERAAAAPDDVAVQLAAATLECELLEFARARERLARLARTSLTSEQRARVAYAHAHAGVQELGARDLAALRAELASLEALPAELEDDRLADLVALDLELGKAAFFGGWKLRAGVAAEPLAQSIAAELARAPASNRAGELRFYAGLCQLALGQVEAADRIFEAHARELPRDRYALLSRLQHSKYAFGPSSASAQTGGSLTDPAMAKTLRAMLDSGANISILSPDGKPMTQEEARAYLEKLLGPTPK
jgi:hypothetical protein